MRRQRPAIAIAPEPDDRLGRAVVEAGGVLAEPAAAAGIVWHAHGDAEALRGLLAASPAEWVHFTCAGVDPFVGAGVVDGARVWTCSKRVMGRTCAEHALALVLAAGRGLHRPGGRRCGLSGSTVLLLGAGGIGGALAAMLRRLGVRFLVVSRSGAAVPGAAWAGTRDALPEVLPLADFVVLALPLTAETAGCLDAAGLAAMRPGAWVVNVARGGLVDTDALVGALRAGRIGGAALDVTDPEPLPADHPLRHLDDVILTPHVAGDSPLAADAALDLLRRNVRRFAAGRPLESAIDPALGY